MPNRLKPTCPRTPEGQAAAEHLARTMAAVEQKLNRTTDPVELERIRKLIREVRASVEPYVKR